MFRESLQAESLITKVNIRSEEFPFGGSYMYTCMWGFVPSTRE